MLGSSVMIMLFGSIVHAQVGLGDNDSESVPDVKKPRSLADPDRRDTEWMGGVPPLGYDIRERRLVINQAEAETVRLIYNLYQELRASES